MVFKDTKFHAEIIKLMFLIFHWGHDVSVSLLGCVKISIQGLQLPLGLESAGHLLIEHSEMFTRNFYRALCEIHKIVSIV